MSAAETKVAVVLEAIDKTRQGLEQARKNVQQFEHQAEQANRNLRQTFRGAALGVANVASSAMNLYNAYDRLAAVQARLMSLEASRQSAQATVIRLQQRLNKLVAEGKQGTEEYVRVQKQLEAAQLRLQQYTLQQYTLQLEDAQDEINKTYIQMALSTVPILTTALDKLSLTSITKAIPAVQGMGMAFKGLMVSMGPIGWVLLGITAAVTAFSVAWINNWGGIQEKTQAFLDWFKGIYEAYIKPVLDAIIGGFVWLSEKVGWLWENSIGRIVEAAEWLYKTLVGGSVFPELMDKISRVTFEGLNQTVSTWKTAVSQIEDLTSQILGSMRISRVAATALAREIAGFRGVSVVTSTGVVKGYGGYSSVEEVIASYERSIALTKQVFGWSETHPAITAYRHEIELLKASRPINIYNENHIYGEVDLDRMATKIASKIASETGGL